VGVRRMGPSSFQWCPATGQGATGTNWSIGSSSWTWGRSSSFWGWWSTGTGCPERLWILLLWRYSRPTWTKSSTACCRWPCFSRGVGLDDPQRSLPTLNILWFCDSVQHPLERWWGGSAEESAAGPSGTGHVPQIHVFGLIPVPGLRHMQTALGLDGSIGHFCE